MMLFSLMACNSNSAPAVPTAAAITTGKYLNVMPLDTKSNANLIADECISAPDVSIQAQVVNLMKDIQEETRCAYLLIAYDLSMVKYISDRIGVLHLGYLMEGTHTVPAADEELGRWVRGEA